MTRTENTNSYDGSVLFFYTYSTMRAAMEKLTPSQLYPFLSVFQSLHRGSIKMETCFTGFYGLLQNSAVSTLNSFQKFISGFSSNALF